MMFFDKRNLLSGGRRQFYKTEIEIDPEIAD